MNSRNVIIAILTGGVVYAALHFFAFYIAWIGNIGNMGMSVFWVPVFVAIIMACVLLYGLMSRGAKAIAVGAGAIVACGAFIFINSERLDARFTPGAEYAFIDRGILMPEEDQVYDRWGNGYPFELVRTYTSTWDGKRASGFVAALPNGNGRTLLLYTDGRTAMAVDSCPKYIIIPMNEEPQKWIYVNHDDNLKALKDFEREHNVSAH